MAKIKMKGEVKLDVIKPHPKNPRIISAEQIVKLGKSIKDFEDMMEVRGIVVDENNIIIGGNQRFAALKENGYETIPGKWVTKVTGWSEERKQEFMIKDNAPVSGEWDFELLEDWDWEELEGWGLEMHELTETSKLSKLEFDSIYFEPKEKPEINLIDCINLEKYNDKIKIIEDSKLSEDTEQIMKIFCQRFIKIDFENVANYYYFNATDEEKKIIERLRLVLCDNGVNGFIEDDILRIHKQIEGWELNN